MAVDTRNKRMSMIGFRTLVRRTMPLPDGAFDKPDRAHLLGLYSGINLSTPIVPAARILTPAAGARVLTPAAQDRIDEVPA